MTMLELITKATTNPDPQSDPSKYPISLSSDPILNLKPLPENPNPSSLALPVTGFELSGSDLTVADSNLKFFKQLKKKLKNPNSLSSSGFADMMNTFLEKIGGCVGVGVNLSSKKDVRCTCELIVKLGFWIGSDVKRLVIEGCFVVENWEILETLIVNKLVDYGVCSDLVEGLIAKRRSDLICLCLRNFCDVKSSDLWKIMKYFLSPSKDACLNMGNVRSEWESQALLAIEKASDKDSRLKNSGLAKEAAVLLMLAYDGFSTPELCLHYLLVSSNVDDVVFLNAVSRLNGDEMMGLIRYLGKWVRKYDRFPQAGPCPNAADVLGLTACKWVPRLEDVVKALGLVLEEHFSLLVLHSEYHEELKAIEGVVSSLVSEGRMCCSMANLIEILKPDIRGA